uniref:Uncharacterized protein n=1 Tax=Oryza glumipatula TaxID=40148 RepID=A0A0D9Y7X8_9ORYZ
MARNGFCSGRNEVARFQIWSGLEASFVSAGPNWKRARFGLPPPRSWPGSNPHLRPSGSNPDARRRRAAGDARRRHGCRCEQTVRKRTDIDGDRDRFPSDVRTLRRLLAGFASALGFLLASRERRGEGEEEEEERALAPLATALDVALALLRHQMTLPRIGEDEPPPSWDFVLTVVYFGKTGEMVCS